MTTLPKSRRKVRFQNDENGNISETIIDLIPRVSDLSEREKDLIWWNEIDFATFNINSQDVIRDIRKSKSMAELLSNAVKASEAKTLKYSFWNKLSMKETSTILPANAQRTSSSPQLNQKTGSTHFLGLVEWISGNPPRRGLEAWGSPKVTLQRESLVAKHTQSVIKLDGKHRSTGSLHNNLLKNETDLRLESEKNSM